MPRTFFSDHFYSKTSLRHDAQLVVLGHSQEADKWDLLLDNIHKNEAAFITRWLRAVFPEKTLFYLAKNLRIVTKHVKQDGV